MRLGIVPTLLIYFLVLLFFYFLVKFFQDSHRIPILNPQKNLKILDSLNLNCERILEGAEPDANETYFKFHPRKYEDQILYSEDRCAKIKELFEFPSKPSSFEESQFPLAYGILAYKEIIQVLFMLSAFYQPQNVYCIAVGENSGSLFWHLLEDLTNCWPNVHFLPRPPIHWGSHEIINSAYSCMEFLARIKNDWKYFQYLSGVDAPLKSNLEMVRILKMLNGSANFELAEYQIARLRGKNISDSPLPLFKSSLSALMPREAANAMASSNTPRDLLNFLKGTGIADESFWATLLANRPKFPIPGSINGRAILGTSLGLPLPTYISRYQLWEMRRAKCGGYLSAGSCVFGLPDVPKLLTRRELVAHKFYLKHQPSAYFCVLREIRRRQINQDLSFMKKDLEFYRNLSNQV